MTEVDWRARFSEVFSVPASAVEARIWAEVYGDEYPAEVEPYSFISVSELDRFVGELGVRAGEVLADVGCGRGGPGLWVASQLNARLVGIDIAPPALDAARARAAALGLAGVAEFRAGSFADTGLPAASVHAVMCVDALVFAEDKRAAAVEFARIVRPGGRVMLTSWDYHRQPGGGLPQVPDHRPVFAEAGFEILSYDETDQWRERQVRTRELMLAAVDELAAERGTDPEEIRTHLLELAARFPCVTRRVLLVARRRP
jgi:SAM-dependent methyltransferase